MKSKITSYVLSGLVMICLISSCNRSGGSGDDLPHKLRAAIKKIQVDGKIDDVNTIYLVIPTTGCERCISEAKKFFLKDIQRQKSRTKFVFTEISSMKIFKAEMGFFQNMDKDRIFLDANNEMYRAGVKSIYPIIFIPSEDGVIVIDQNNYESLLKLSALSK